MQYEYIRTGYFKYGKSIRQLSRDTGHCRETINKVIKGIFPEYKMIKERPAPVLGDFKIIIKEWLERPPVQASDFRHPTWQEAAAQTFAAIHAVRPDLNTEQASEKPRGG